MTLERGHAILLALSVAFRERRNEEAAVTRGNQKQSEVRRAEL